MSTKFSIVCPMHAQGNGGHLNCGGEMVEAVTSFNSPTVEVAPCASLKAQGWEGPQAVLWRSQVERYTPETTVVRHRDGLVSFAG